MTFAEFESLAEQEWDRIPDAYRQGVDALVVTRDAKAPGRSDVYTLGECVTESWPSDYGGPDTIRSELILYYGSFRRLAALDDTFDWEAELWETLTHELQHHLESLADEDDLEELDAAMEQHFRRHDGETFDPLYYRAGEPLDHGWFRLDEAYFREAETVEAGDSIAFDWAGSRYVVPIQGPVNEITYVTVDGVEQPPAELVLVIVPRQPLASRIRAVLRREVPRVRQLHATALRQST